VTLSPPPAILSILGNLRFLSRARELVGSPGFPFPPSHYTETTFGSIENGTNITPKRKKVG
jgi:hypothetical protein